ncbi:hypothetical protein ACOME3_004578 [Neoechinorhynchus agilis]
MVTLVQSSGGGLFGSSAVPKTTASTSNSIFGMSSLATPAARGTTVKFEPVTLTEMVKKGNTNVKQNLKYMSVCFMKNYESKSIEELRWEDYDDGRKGKPVPTTTAPSLAITPSSGLFGATVATPTPATTTSSTSLFGSTFTSGFGTSSTGGNFFKSATTPATTTTSSLFGASKPSIFGSTITPAATTTSSSLFGFGVNKPFGATSTTTASLTPFGFGSTSAAATTTTSSLFGSSIFGGSSSTALTASKPSGLFGGFASSTTTATSTPSLFASSFSTPATTQSSLFGTTTGSVFGSNSIATPAGAFGASSLFASKPLSLATSAPVIASTPVTTTPSRSPQEIARKMLHHVHSLPYRALYENKEFHKYQQEMMEAKERMNEPLKLKPLISSFAPSTPSIINKSIDVYLKSKNQSRYSDNFKQNTVPVLRPIAPNFRRLVLEPFVDEVDNGQDEISGTFDEQNTLLSRPVVTLTRPDYYTEPPLKREDQTFW